MKGKKKLLCGVIIQFFSQCVLAVVTEPTKNNKKLIERAFMPTLILIEIVVAVLLYMTTYNILDVFSALISVILVNCLLTFLILKKLEAERSTDIQSILKSFIKYKLLVNRK